MIPRPYPPDWCDADTAAYLVSMSVDTFKRHVEARVFPEPTILGGKHLWSRIRLTEALEALEASANGGDDPVMGAIRGKAKDGGRRASA